MKKFSITIAVLCFICAICSLIDVTRVYASDIWLTKQGNTDIYIITETIDSDGSTYAKATTKNVLNGRLIGIDKRIYAYVDAHKMWWYNTEEGKKNNLKPTRVWDGVNDPILGYILTHH